MDYSLNREKITETIALGIDVGSTTAKLAAVKAGKILLATYERHFS